MKEQFGGIYWQNPNNISRPLNNTYVRLFRDLADNLYKIKKFDGSIELFATGTDLFPNVVNHITIWVNGDAVTEGDGSLLNPFKTIQAAVASMQNINTNLYNVLVYPHEYTGPDVTLPTKAGVGFIALGIPATTSFGFDINFKPDADWIGQSFNEKIAFKGYNFDSVNITGGAIQILEGTVNFNDITANPNVILFIGLGALQNSTFRSKLVSQNPVLIDNITIESGGSAVISSMLDVNLASRITIKGTATLRTVAYINNDGISPYVNGIPIGPDTPTWTTDFASNSAFDGVLNKVVIGNGITGTFLDQGGNTIHVVNGLITALS